MKSRIHFPLIVATLLAIPGLLFAQVPAATSPEANAGSVGPRIAFDSENFNFGQFTTTDPLIKHTFTISNTGDQTLDIQDVHGSCSCTTIGGGWKAQSLTPGQSIQVPIQITSANVSGQFTKTVTVTSNDKNRPRVTLILQGTNFIPIQVTPQQSAQFTLKPDTTNTETQTLQIFNRSDEPLTLFAPECNTNAFSAELKTNVPGKEFQLVVTAYPPPEPALLQGMRIIQGQITLKTSFSTMPVLNITALASVYPEITILPDGISIPGGPLARGQTNWITVQDNTRKDLTLWDPTVNVPGPTAAIKILQTNRVYNVVVGFPAGFEVKPGDNVAVSVKTDNARYSVIRIPVTPMLGAPQQTIRQSMPLPGVPLPSAQAQPPPLPKSQ